MMKQTIYLVDSENVNDAWVPLLPKLGRRDQVIVFHTKNSPHFTTESASLMADFQNNLTWEKCFTGTNGLDFQLVSRLGFLICKKPRATFVIVSNDTGFDAAIKYWVQEGKQVSRIKGASCSEEAPLTEVQEKIVLEDAPDRQRRRPRKKKKKSQGQNAAQGQPGNGKNPNGGQSVSGNGRNQNGVQGQPGNGKNQNGVQSGPGNGKSQNAGQSGSGSDKLQNGIQNGAGNGKPQDAGQSRPEGGKRHEQGDPGSGKAQGQAEGGKAQAEKQEKSIPVSSVLGICRSISMSRHELVHESLVALLGAEDGREVYHFLKENQEFQLQLRKIYLADRNARVENYLKVIFEYHKEELTDPDRIRGIINKYTAGDRNGIFQALAEAFGHKKGARYYGILKSHVRVLKKI